MDLACDFIMRIRLSEGKEKALDEETFMFT